MISNSAGVYPWLDSESLLAGQNWKVAIKHVIRNSRYFILLLSTNSVDKEGNIQAETQEARDLLKDFSPSEIFVIPVHLDNCTKSWTKDLRIFI